MNTEIPPGFPITYCPPGEAKGIEPNYCKSSGGCMKGGRSWADPVASLIYKAVESKKAPKKESKSNKARKPFKKNHKQVLRERAEALFS